RTACPTADPAAAQAEAQRICGAPPAPTCSADKVTGASNQYATDQLLLPKPTGGMTYAADIDGDGATENQWLTVIEVVSVAGLDLQTSLDSAVAKGDIVILANLKAPDLMAAGCAGLTYDVAQSPAMGDPLPKYDGSDTFRTGATPAMTLYGGITSGRL